MPDQPLNGSHAPTEAGKLTVVANGKPLILDAGTTIGQLAEKFKLSPKAVLVELNGLALLRSEWPGQVLFEGDRLEFIRVAAGG